MNESVDEIDIHQLPPKNIFQRFVVIATIGLVVLSLSPSWLTHIQVPRGNISISGVIIIVGIVAYWVCGYAPVWTTLALRKLLGINRFVSTEKSNIVQTIIRKVSAVIFFFYCLGFVLGLSDLKAFGISTAALVGYGWFLWWTAGETPYLLRKTFSKSRPPIRAMIFFVCVIGACVFGIYFLISNPFYLFIPDFEHRFDPLYDFSLGNLVRFVRCNIPFVSEC